MTDKKLYMDFWYGNTLSECTSASWTFSDCDCIYRGNLYIGEKPVGDYSCTELQTIQQAWEKSHSRR